MTPEAQRIAIAEACPGVACKNINGEWVWREQQSRRFDPLSDLNAMHEAEKVLTDQQRTSYLDKLYEVCNPHSMLNDDWNLTCATAAQRAEAFLRTLNLFQ